MVLFKAPLNDKTLLFKRKKNNVSSDSVNIVFLLTEPLTYLLCRTTASILGYMNAQKHICTTPSVCGPKNSVYFSRG